MKEGIEKRLEFIHRAELLNELTNDRFKICVTGGRGKTSISYHIYCLLKNLGEDPFLLSGYFVEGESGMIEGKGPYVVELNEADMLDAEEKADILVINYFSRDHIWSFNKSEEKMKIGYKNLINRCKKIFYYHDDYNLREITQSCLNKDFISFGTEGDYKIYDINENLEDISYTLEYQNKKFEIKNKIQGFFQAYNIAAAIAVVHQNFDFPLEKIIEATESLHGAKDRTEVIYKDKNLILIRDFGPNYYNLESSIKSASKYKKEISIIFDPQNKEREKTFRKEYIDILKNYRHASFWPKIAINGNLLQSKEDIKRFLDESKGVCILSYVVHVTPQITEAVKEWISEKKKI